MSSTITNVAGHICLMRQQICPKTSYATSGSAAKLLYVFENKQIARSSCQVPIVNEIQNMLTLTSGSSVGPLKSEFESSEIFDLDNFIPAAGNINGHVIVFLNTCKDDSHSLDNGISGSLDLLARKRSKLVIYISVESSDTMLPVTKKMNSLETMISKKLSDERYRNITSNCYSINVENSLENTSLTIEMRSLHVATANLDHRSISMLGYNKQPAVCSLSQFKYLKQLNSEGWQRVLQRLADKELYLSEEEAQIITDLKYSTVHWNDIISKILSDPQTDDYTIYSAIRRFVLGSSLDTDLQISSSHHCHSVDDPAIATVPTEKKNCSSGSGKGRASHMAAMIIENIPSHLYPPNASGPKSSQLSSSSPFPIKLLLDYGCAEGSITAELGRQLRLTPQQVIGADVRVIASEGFTFMPLPAEEEAT
eukprot:gene27337-35944_t